MIIKNLSKKYIKKNEEIEIFKDLNVEFELGKFYMIIGPSGSGKTSLIKIIGLLDSNFDGSVLVGTKDVSHLNDKELSRMRYENIGIIFQDYYLNPRLTAFENVLVATILDKSLSKLDRKKKVESYLKKVGLENREKHFPAELSGGECQRVCIARSLINNPDYILCDEPTGSLDPDNAANIIKILKGLADDGKCIIMVTHDMNNLKNADIIYRLENKILVRCDINDIKKCD